MSGGEGNGKSMVAPRSGSPSNADDDAIARGDRLARLGEWREALAAWQTALDGPEAARASKRIHWFLDETDNRSPGAVPKRTRRTAYRALLAATFAAFLGTAVTVLGTGRSGTESTIVAIAAWVAFVVAIGLCLIFARMLGTPTESPRTKSSHAEAIALAMSRAATVEPIEPDPEKGARRSSPVQDRSGTR